MSLPHKHFPVSTQRIIKSRFVQNIFLYLKVDLLTFKAKRLFSFGPVLIVINLFILLPQSRFDPDPHHDGYMFAGAVAVSEGRVPNRDFLAQYGPLVPLIHGIWLRIFGEYLINLRILTSILLALTGYLVYVLVSQFRSKRLAFTAQLLWVLSYPIQPLPHSMPWATVISSFLMIIILYLYLKLKRLSLHPVWAILLGFIIGSLFLIRVQLVLLLLFTQINFLYKRKQRFRGNEQKSALLISIASLTSFVASLFFMYRAGSLEQYILQCVTWPSKFYGQTYLPTSIFSKDGFVYWSTWYYYPFFFVSIWLLLRVLRNSYKISFHDFTPVQVLACSLTILLVSFGYVYLTNYDFYPKSYLNPVLQLQWLLLRLPLAFFFFLAAFFVLKFSRELLNLTLLSYDNFVLFIGLSAALLLYPGSGPIHLWWSSPVLLAAFFTQDSFKLFNRDFLKSDYEMKVILSTSLVFASLLIPSHLNQSRVPFESQILKGMMGPAESVRDIDSTVSALRKYELSEPRDREIFFDCRDGMYSVANGSFSSVGLQFVNWGLEDLSSAPDGVPIFICNSMQDELVNSYLVDKYRIVEIISLTNGRVNAIIEPTP